MTSLDAGQHMETAPIWWQTTRVTSAGRHLVGPKRAELVIVGGGLAGLAAAYFVAKARPQTHIVLLEAEQIGAGATGRSTGIVGPGLSMPMAQMRRKYGDTVAAAAFDASQHGVRLLRDVIQLEGIDCDARNEPHTLAALSTPERSRMQLHLDALAALGRPMSWLDEAELIELAGPSYIAGIAYRDVLLVDPYRLAAGLADVVRGLGVEIYERSRVLAFRGKDGQPTVTTAAGHVIADSVLLTMDGYAGRLNPQLTSVVPLRTHVLATEPLSAENVAQLGWGGKGGVIDQRNFFNYYRLTADQRLVFGGGAAIVPKWDPVRDAQTSSKVFSQLRADMTSRFPSLADVKVTARWTGLTAASLDRLPVVDDARNGNGVYSIGTWCGHGLSQSIVEAERFAKVLAGESVPSLPWHRRRAPRVPTKFARSTGVRWYLAGLKAADRRSMRDIQPKQRPLVESSTETASAPEEVVSCP